MDRGAWQATVHWAIESWTRLERLGTHTRETEKEERRRREGLLEGLLCRAGTQPEAKATVSNQAALQPLLTATQHFA